MKVNAFRRTAAILITVFMTAGIFAGSLAGCEKEGDKGASATGAGTAAKTTTAAAKTVTTAKSTAATASSSAAAKTATNVPDGTQAASAEATGDIEGNENGGSTGEQNEEQDEVAETAYDLNGMEIEICWPDLTRIPYADSTEPKLQFLWKNAKAMESKYNCKFTFSAQVSSVFNANLVNYALAGTEYREVLNTTDNRIMPTLVDSGYFLALEEYLDTDSDVWKDQIAHSSATTGHWRGKYWGITEIGAMYGGQNHVYYYEPIMAREGINIWDDYVLKNNWNWSTFLDVAIRTTKDLDGDGIVDQWGTMSVAKSLADSLIYGNGARYLEYSDGRYYCSLNSPQTVKALQFLSDLYNIYKVAKTGTVAQIQQNRSRIAMTFYGIAGLYTSAQLGEGIYMAHNPIGPDANGVCTGYRVQRELFVFPSNIKNAKEVVNIIAEWMHLNYLDLKSTDPLRNVALVWYKNMDQINVDRILKIRDMGGWAEEPVNVFGTLNTIVSTNIVNKVISLETPVTSALDSNMDLLQNIINDILK